MRNTFILASTPTILTAPTKVSSSKSAITIQWSLTSNGGSPVLGYKLYQKNMTTGGEFLVYDGSNIPTVSSYTATGLIAGNSYAFRASAINRVGEGPLSPYSISIKAANAPGKPHTPTYVSSSSTTITITWQDNEDNGGSVITAYNIYLDSGSLASDTFTFVDSTASLTYILDNTVHVAYLTGDKYRFRITVANEIGESEPSNDVRIALAAIPA